MNVCLTDVAIPSQGEHRPDMHYCGILPSRPFRPTLAIIAIRNR